MYIYLPNGFILFPKIRGRGIVESIVTSINGYFLVPVSEMDVYIVFFTFLWFFWFVWLLLLLVFFVLFLFYVKHRMV